MAEEKVAREDNDTVLNNLNNMKEGGENEGIEFGGSSTTTTTSSSKTTPKGKSCKGCLYYSSTLKSNARNPLCVGITRSLPQVPRYIVGESEMEASKKGRSFKDFRYGCIGYSVYPDGGKNNSGEAQDSQTELPVCVGLEVLVDRKTVSETAPVHIHNNKQDGHVVPQRPTHKPPHSVGDEFLSKFTRNANLVAMGVAKNARKVGNHIKESVDNILYPYRRRPK